MPELPEVEDARCLLEEWLTGRRIERAEVRAGRPIRGAAATLARALTGRRAGAPTRRGKHLLLPLDGAAPTWLHLHFGMTGRLAPVPARHAAPSAARLTLRSGGGPAIHLLDPRRLGTVELVADPAEVLERLGIDPWAAPFTPEDLATALRGGRLPLKAALMDQRRLAGLGNIQASEALFLAGLHPNRPAGSLGPRAVDALHEGIRRTLRTTLARLSRSRRARTRRLRAGQATAFLEPLYVSEGAAGGFQVYGRTGRPCPRCGATLRAMVIRGRTSPWCPRCQAPGPRPRA